MSRDVRGCQGKSGEVKGCHGMSRDVRGCQRMSGDVSGFQRMFKSCSINIDLSTEIGGFQAAGLVSWTMSQETFFAMVRWFW